VANATYATSAGSVANATFATSAGVVTTNAQPNITSVGSLTSLTVGGNISTASAISATGNITGGSIRTGGLISATGNIAGNYFIGNGSQLTGLGGPAFIATQTSGHYQTIPASPSGISYLGLIYNSASKNIGGGYDTATGIFTAPIAGFYQVNASIGVNPFANVNYYGAGLIVLYQRVSGVTSTVASGPFISPVTLYYNGFPIQTVISQSSVSALVYLNAGDALECVLGYITNAPNIWTTETNLVPSSFEAVWIRGA